MNPKWLKDPAIFSVGQEQPHCFISQEPDQVLSLNGDWDFKYMDNDWSKIPVPGVFQAFGYGDVGDKLEIPAISPSELSLPVNNEFGEYRKKFDLPDEWKDCKIILSFGSVNAGSFYWLNDQFLGYNEASKTEVEFDVTDKVRKGDNQLKVLLYRWCTASFMEAYNALRLCGIERDVLVYCLPSAYIKDYHISTSFQMSKGGGFALTIDHPEKYEVQVKIFDNMDLIYSKSCKENMHTSGLNVDPWSHENPKLYRLELTLVDEGRILHQIQSQIGFRTIKITGGQLLLNGETLTIKGIYRSEHHESSFSVIDDESMLHDIKMIKEANIIAVQNTEHPNHRRWYELCDKYGLLVIDTVNIKSYMGGAVETLNESLFKEAYMDRTKRMFHRSKNHACVIMWSIENLRTSVQGIDDCFTWLKRSDAFRPIVSFKQVNIGDIVTFDNLDLNSLQSIGNADRPILMKMDSRTSNLENLDKILYEVENKEGIVGMLIDSLVDRAMKSAKGYWDYNHNVVPTGFERKSHLNGILLPDRRPHPTFYEVKKVFQNISFSIDLDDDIIVLTNHKIFEPIFGVLEIRIWDINKQWDFERYQFQLEPGKSDIMAFDRTKVVSQETLLLDAKAFLNNGELAGEEQFVLHKKQESIPHSSKSLHFPFTIEPNFSTSGPNTDLLDEFFPELKEELINDNIIKVTLTCKLDCITPNLGIKILMPLNYNSVTYLGRGPHENYPRRNRSANWGLYYSSPEKMKPNYIDIRDAGYRSETEVLFISDEEGTGFRFSASERFGFSYLSYDFSQLNKLRGDRRLFSDIADDQNLTLCIDTILPKIESEVKTSSRLAVKNQQGKDQYKFEVYISAL